MPTKLLHVEDDLSLAELVHLSFQSFGFRGEALIASTVHEACEILADWKKHPQIDLVVSDMNLPDGLGTDIVRTVRADPVRSRVPVLILSGTTDGTLVDRAYALGANSYVSKGGASRDITSVVKTLYDHWLRDVLLPGTSAKSRTHAVIAQGVILRTRVGALFSRFSAACNGDQVQSGFWMSLALRNGNLANLLAFLDQQMGDRELASINVERQLVFQQREARLLDQIERVLDKHPDRTLEIARDAVIDLMAQFDPEMFVQVTGQLFPVVQAAVVALREVVTRGFDEVTEWVETYGTSIDAERIAQLRAVTKHLHELLAADPTHQPDATL